MSHEFYRMLCCEPTSFEHLFGPAVLTRCVWCRKSAWPPQAWYGQLGSKAPGLHVTRLGYSHSLAELGVFRVFLSCLILSFCSTGHKWAQCVFQRAKLALAVLERVPLCRFASRARFSSHLCSDISPPSWQYSTVVFLTQDITVHLFHNFEMWLV